MRGIALFFRAYRDVAFMKYVVDYCEGFGWYWEPQDPQMPHINVLDFAVFPKMSRNHCELVRKRVGTKVLKEDEIWEGAQAIWNTMPFCDITRSFVLSYRTTKKIVEVKGNKGELHANVQKDFMDTETGIVRRDYNTLEAPKATREIRKIEIHVVLQRVFKFNCESQETESKKVLR